VSFFYIPSRFYAFIALTHSRHFMTNTSATPLNPWISILTKPRATIQQIVDTNPSKHLWLLAGLHAYYATFLTVIVFNMYHRSSPSFLLLSLIFISKIVGLTIIYYYVNPFVSYKVSKWLGGTASLINVRAARLWSVVFDLYYGVPYCVVGTFVTLADLMIWWGWLFNFAQEHFILSLGITVGCFGLFIAVWFWSFRISVLCLSQVQKISKWRAFITLIPAFMITTIVAAIFETILRLVINLFT
jgi:hypothetical protein